MIKRLAPFALYSNIFLVMLGLGVIAPNLTDIRHEFGVSYGAISWGVSAFAFARLVTNLPAGIAAGKYSRLPLLMTGTACVMVGSIVAGLSTGLPLFLVARAVSGVGSSLCTTVGLTAVLDDVDPSRRGRASGTFHSALGGGGLFGPGFGALLSSLGDWRWSLFGAAGAAGLSLVLLTLVFRAGGSKKPAEVTAGAEGTKLSPLQLVFGAAFVAYASGFAIFFMRGGVQQTLIPLLGRDAVGLSAASLSVVMMSSAAISTLLGPSVGGLSDRIGRQRVLLPGLCLLAIGGTIGAAAHTLPVFVLGVFLTSLAGTTFSIPASMIVDVVGARGRSTAIGIYRVVGDFALTSAPFASGYLIDVQGFAAAGIFSSGIVVLALAAALLRSGRIGAPLPQPQAELGP